jgi:hypothetical protein
MPMLLAANEMVRSFLTTPCDSLLMVDADQVFTPETLTRLRGDSRAWGYDGVGALYIGRSAHRPLLMRETPETAGLLPHEGKVEYYWIEKWPDGDLVDVDVMGLGFTLLRRHVFEELPPPWFCYTPQNPDASDDIYFFRRSHKLGRKFAINTKVKIGHIMDEAVLGYDNVAYPEGGKPTAK